MNSGDCTVLATVALKSTRQLKPWQLRTAKQMMLAHLDVGISVTELAEACALSRSHFSRMFKESTRVPPQQWMREQRIRKSKQLLLDARMLLADIALDCGFYDQAHFCRAFMRAEGLTPLAWQRLTHHRPASSSRPTHNSMKRAAAREGVAAWGNRMEKRLTSGAGAIRTCRNAPSSWRIDMAETNPTPIPARTASFTPSTPAISNATRIATP